MLSLRISRDPSTSSDPGLQDSLQSIGSRGLIGSPLAGAVADFTDSGFDQEVLKASNTVLVDFWAPWCGPCRLMAPLMDWAAETYGDRLSVGKLEVDGNPATRDQYQVQGIPTLMLFRDGEELARHEGAIAKPQLQAFLDAHL